MVRSECFLNNFSACESARLHSQGVSAFLKGLVDCCQRLEKKKTKKKLLNRLPLKLEVLRFIPNSDEPLMPS